LSNNILFLFKNYIVIYIILKKLNKRKMGIGDWGLGIGDWAQSPIPNPQSPIPNPQLYCDNLICLFNIK